MKKHSIKVGTSNFRRLISSDGLTADLSRLFVDKTLFIKDFLDHSNDVVLITRQDVGAKVQLCLCCNIF